MLLLRQALKLLVYLAELGLEFFLLVLLQLSDPRYLVPVFIDLSLENASIFVLLSRNL